MISIIFVVLRRRRYAVLGLFLSFLYAICRARYLIFRRQNRSETVKSTMTSLSVITVNPTHEYVIMMYDNIS